MFGEVEEQKIEVSPVVEAKKIRASFIYDPFNSSDRTVVDLDWEKGKTVAEYLGDLPSDVELAYSVSGRVLTAEELVTTSITDSDSIVVTVVPQGKIGTIIGMVVAVAVASVFTLGAAGVITGVGLAAGSVGAWVSAGVAIASAAMTVAQGVMSLTQKAQKTNDSPTYGIDGAKNTNTEDTPVPIVYGTMRVAGNKVNIFVENTISGAQFLYLQYVVSEGPVKSISDFRINDNPASNFGDSITTDVRLGSVSQAPLQWFSDATTPNNVSVKLTQNAFYYTTKTKVDRLRLDFYFPNGSYHVTSKGKYQTKSTDISAAYALQNADGSFTNWVSFDAGTAWYQLNSAASTSEQNVQALRLTVAMVGNDGDISTPYSVQVRCKSVNNKKSRGTSAELGSGVVLPTGQFTQFGSDSGNIQNTVIYENGNQKLVAATIYRTFEIVGLTNDEWAFEVSGGTIVGVEGYTTNSLTFKENSRTTIRRSINSTELTNGIYQIRVSRNTAEATDTSNVDQIYLSDVNEITTDPVAYNATAFYGVRATLGTTINSEPTCSALVEGVLVNIYDRTGNITANQWSNNPADVALDMLLNNERFQYAISPSRIDFAAFDDWRSFCSNNGLVFNGIFDTTTTMWDALTQVTRVGHAGLSLQGIMWSVVMEAPADPVMLLSQDSVVKGSFQTMWTGRKDRANLVEVQYLDATDNYKQHSVFALDDSYLTNGDSLVQTSVTMTGVTDAAQAQKEAWLTLNLGRYINQSIVFQVPYQALGLAVGDVFLFQHNMPAWGESAMISDVTDQNNFTIDSPIEDKSGSWKMLSMQSLVNLASGDIKAGSGSVIQIQSLGAPIWTDADKSKPYYDPSVLLATDQDWASRVEESKSLRVVFDGDEYGVLDITIPESGITQVTLDRDFTSSASAKAQFFRVDVLTTASVTLGDIDSTKNTQSVTINGWDSSMPSVIVKGSRIVFGRENVTAKPFRVTKITYKEDHTREVTGQEYNASLYTDNPSSVPNYSGLSLEPLQVSGITVAIGSEVSQGGAVSYFGDIGWIRPLADQRIYSGARVYVSRNFGDFAQEQDIPNPGQSVRITGNVGDNIRVKIVAYTQNGGSAAYDSAPIVAFVLTNETSVPDPVGNNSLTAVGGIRLIALNWNLVNDAFINGYEIYESSENDIAKAYRVYYGMGNSYIRGGLDANQTMFYWIRTVSNSGTTSTWSDSVSATTRFILVEDLEAAIKNTAVIAEALLKDVGTPLSFSGDNLPNVADYQDKQVINYKGVLYQKKDNAWVKMIGAITVDSSGVLTSDQIGDIVASKVTTPLTAEQQSALSDAKSDQSLTDDQKSQIDAAIAAGQASQDVLNILLQVNKNAAEKANADLAALTLSSIPGQISDSQIQTINAAKIAGQLTAQQIASITATQITGKVTSAQIASIDAASQITGKLAAENIHGITPSQIIGQLTASQISDLDFAKISGTVAADQLSRAPSNNLIWDGCGQDLTNWVIPQDDVKVESVSLSDGTPVMKITALKDTNASILWQTWGVAFSMAPGVPYEYQIKTATTSTSATIFAVPGFYNETGSFVGEGWAVSSLATSLSSVSKLADFQTVWGHGFKFTSGRLRLQVNAKAGEILYVTQVLVGASLKNVTEPMVWVNGSTPLVNASAIQGVLDSAKIPTIDLSKISGTVNRQLTSAQIASLDATKVAGQLTSAQIANIEASKLTGLIVSKQIESLNADLIAGTVSLDNIPSIPLTQVVGTDNGKLTSAQIASIDAAKVTGTLANDNIPNIDLSKINGTSGGQLTSDQIKSLDAAKVAGTLTADSIPTISIDKVAGVVPLSQIPTIPLVQVAGTVNGQLTSGQIASIDAAKVAGTLASNNIPTLDLSKIAGTSNGKLTSDQISGLDAAKLTTQITSTQITDGAISTAKLAAGAVTASTIAAGSITTEKLAVANPSNLIWNDVGNRIDGWDNPTGGNVNVTTWGTFATQIGNVFLVDGNFTGGGGYVSCFWGSAIPVMAGMKIQAQAKIANDAGSHARVEIAWFDANMSKVGGSIANNVDLHSDYNTSAGYILSSAVATPPTNAAYAKFSVVMTDASSGHFSMRFTQCAIGYASANATQVAPWAPGGQTQISGGQIVTGSIMSDAISANAITAGKIATNAVTAGTIAAGAVTASNIVSGTITSTQISANTITGSNLVANTIGTREIVANSITSAQIAANTITGDRLVANTIGAREIIAGSVTAEKIASSAITTDKLSASAVTADKIRANAVTAGKISANAVTAGTIAAGAVTAGTIAAGAVTTETLAVASSSNVIGNSTFTMNSAGWSSGFLHINNKIFSTAVERGESVPFGTGALYVYGESDGQEGIVDCYNKDTLPVQAGQRVCGQVRVMSFANTGDVPVAFLYIGFYDQTGKSIATTVSDPLVVAGDNSANINGYGLLYLFATAPANATACRINLRMRITANSSGRTFFTNVALGLVNANTTEVPAWTPGGITTINGAQIITGSVSADQIAASAITSDKIATNAITSGKIAAGAVTAGTIAAGAVTTSTLASGAVTADTIAANAITSPKIATGAITADKMSANSVTAASIAAGTITSTQIAANTITGDRLLANTIGTREIVANSITTSQIAAGGVNADRLVAGSITTAQIAANAITATQIAANAVTATQIAAGAVTTSKLTVGSSTNLIWNSCGTLTADGWVKGYNFESSAMLTFAPTTSARYYPGFGSVVVSHTSGSENALTFTGSAGDLHYVYWGTNLAYASDYGYVVVSARILPEWATFGMIGVDYLDANGTLIGSDRSSKVTQNGMNFSLTWFSAKPVSGTVKLRLWVAYGQNSGSGSLGHLSFTQAMIGYSSVLATEAPVWTPGGVTQISGGQIIAGSVTAGTIAAGTITSAQIAANTITGSNILANTIGTREIVANSITTNQIAAGGVNADRLTAGSVTATQIAAGTITATQIAASTITGDKISAGTISATNLAAGSVTTDKIAAGAVTTEKLSVGSNTNIIWNSCGGQTSDGWGVYYTCDSSSYGITSGAAGIDSNGAMTVKNTFGTSALGQIQLQWNSSFAPGTAKAIQGQIMMNCTSGTVIAMLTVRCLDANGNRVGDLNSVTYTLSSTSGWTTLSVVRQIKSTVSKIVFIPTFFTATGTTASSFSVDMTRAAFGSAPANATQVSDWAPGGVTQISGGQITAASITASQIAASTITSTQIAAGTITTTQIAAGTIIGGNLVANTIGTREIVAKSITANQIATGSLTADVIGAGAIVTSKLAAGAVTADTIASNAITSPKISAGAITSDKIVAGAVTSEKMTVSAPSNVIWNSCATLTTAGWNLPSPPPNGSVVSVGQSNGNRTYSGVGSGAICAGKVGSPVAFSAASGTEFYLYWNDLIAYSSDAGYVIASARLLPEWSVTGSVGVDYLGANNNLLGSDRAGYVSQNGNNFIQAWICKKPVSGTVKLRFWISMRQTGGSGTYGHLTFTQAMLGFSSVAATEAPAWTPGGATQISGGQLTTGSVTAAQIAASTITGDKISGSTITGANIVGGTITSDHVAVRSLNGGNIATNTITADNLAAGSVTTEKLAVGSANNILPNSCLDYNGAQTTGWNGGLSVWQVTSFQYTPYYINGLGVGGIIATTGLSNNTSMYAEMQGIPVVGGRRYYAGAHFIQNWGGLTQSVGIASLDANGNLLGYIQLPDIQVTTNTTVTNGAADYVRYGGFFDLPSNTATVWFRIIVYNRSGSDITSTPIQLFTKCQLALVADGTTEMPDWVAGGTSTIDGANIKTGTLGASKIAALSITGDKIAGNTISADKLVANSITSAQIQAGAIGSDQIAANAIRANNLAVDDVLIAHSAQIGTLVVGTSNIQDNSVTIYGYAELNGSGGSILISADRPAGAIVSFSATGSGSGTVRASYDYGDGNGTITMTSGGNGIFGSFPLNLFSGNNGINVTFSVSGNVTLSKSRVCVIGRYK